MNPLGSFHEHLRLSLEPVVRLSFGMEADANVHKHAAMVSQKGALIKLHVRKGASHPGVHCWIRGCERMSGTHLDLRRLLC